MNWIRNVSMFGLLCVAATHASAAGETNFDRLCLNDDLCLGMSLDEVTQKHGFSRSSIPLKPKIAPMGNITGVNSAGKRIAVEMPSYGLLTRESVKFMRENIKTLCFAAITFPLHIDHLRHADGGKIRVSFFAHESGELVAMEITRVIRGNAPESEWAAFEQKLKERYGSNFHGSGKTSSWAAFERYSVSGPLLRLKVDDRVINNNLEAAKFQPACKDKLAL